MAVVKATPDGYTFVVGTVGEFAINPALYKNIPYNVERDLTPVAMISDTPLVLAASSASPYRSVQDVITAAKAKPGDIPTASPGNGTFNHGRLSTYGAFGGKAAQTRQSDRTRICALLDQREHHWLVIMPVVVPVVIMVVMSVIIMVVRVRVGSDCCQSKTTNDGASNPPTVSFGFAG